ncbi:hypothetical protein, partial [Paralimibaculum aggregatum]|uniref:hypothetical protein n=1 Tax=Paralimibaculum aggregatum TaxID=3036245 RepID=UPI0025533EA4
IAGEARLVLGEILSEITGEVAVEEGAPFGLSGVVDLPDTLDLVSFEIIGTDGGLELGTLIDDSDPGILLAGGGLTVAPGTTADEVPGATDYFARIGVEYLEAPEIPDGAGTPDEFFDLALTLTTDGAGNITEIDFSGEILDLIA